MIIKTHNRVVQSKYCWKNPLMRQYVTWLFCGCVSKYAKLLRKPDTESQNINLCTVDLYFFNIMIKSTMTAQPSNDSVEKLRWTYKITLHRWGSFGHRAHSRVSVTLLSCVMIFWFKFAVNKKYEYKCTYCSFFCEIT